MKSKLTLGLELRLGLRLRPYSICRECYRLICRCIDLIREKKDDERIQSLKLAFIMLKIYSEKNEVDDVERIMQCNFPNSLLMPIVSLTYDGLDNGIGNQSDRYVSNC